MILDSLDHAELYEALHPSFGAAFRFIREHAGDDLPAGRYEICDGVYAMVQQLELIPPEQGKWEAHRNYIDIQFILSGVEGIGATQLDSLTETVPYDLEKDIAFYSGEGDICRVAAGKYMILYPHDAHMPMLRVKEDCRSVKKIVVKVRG